MRRREFIGLLATFAVCPQTALGQAKKEDQSSPTRIGLLDDVTDPKGHPQRKEIEAAGQAMEIKIIPAEVLTSGDIRSAYEALSASGVEVVVVEQSNMLINARSQIAEIAAARMLPTVYGYREHVEAGGLISYGVNLDWCFHRTAYYVDKILKGAKPSELPTEFPTKLQLVINLKTAKTLKLVIPPAALGQKQTCAVQNVMSALPPKADMCGAKRDVR